MSAVCRSARGANVHHALQRVLVEQMSHAECHARLMRAERLTGDQAFGLPPGQPLSVIPIACLPGAPADWVRAAGTYVCLVDVGYGLWFDWTRNPAFDTAVVPSVKGMNPITGCKLESLRMEKYCDKCPVHGEPFAHGRHCQKCGYAWPPANHVSWPNVLWWDGFKTGDSVRQFFFTDEDRRDIASAAIGKQNTVPAFGFAFYKTKVSRQPIEAVRSRGYMTKGACGQSLGNYWDDELKSSAPLTFDSFTGDKDTFGPLTGVEPMDKSYNVSCSAKGMRDFTGQPGAQGPTSPLRFAAEPQRKRSAEVSVGAGARIDQQLRDDPLPLEGWLPEPQAVIRLYFVFEEQLMAILSKGVEPLVNKPEGYLPKGVPVG